MTYFLTLLISIGVPTAIDGGVDAVVGAVDATAFEPRCPVGDPPIYVWRSMLASQRIIIRPNGDWHHLEVPPGTYRITRHPDRQADKRPVRVGRSTLNAELCVELVGAEPLDPGRTTPRITHSDLKAFDIIATIAGGRTVGEGGGAFGRFNLAGFTGSIPLVFALTDNIYWAAPWPGLGWHFGEHGGVESFVWAGMYDWGFSIGEQDLPPPFVRPDETDFRLPDLHLFAYLGIGADTRLWLHRNVSVNAMISLTTITGGSVINDQDRAAPNTLRQNMELGLSLTVPWIPVTINAGVGVHGNWLSDGEPPRVIASRSPRFNFALTLGSRIRRNFLLLPLVQVHINDFMSVDLFSWATYNFPTGRWQETYLVGLGAVF